MKELRKELINMTCRCLVISALNHIDTDIGLKMVCSMVATQMKADFKNKYQFEGFYENP